jgi:AcrR family transcriptional regulator
MGRSKTISDEALLGAARAVFVRDGASGSTAEIARLAGVSEATLFKRFSTKAELFLAALTPPAADVAAIIDAAEACEDARDAVITIGALVLAHFRIVLPLAIPLISNPLIGLEGLRQHAGRSGPEQLVEAIAGFFAEQARRGRISARDPLASAMALVACVHSIAQFEVMGLHPTMSGASVRTLLDALWNGLQPETRR